MVWFKKANPRRTEIRKNRPSSSGSLRKRLKTNGAPGSVLLAAAFLGLTAAILLSRQNMTAYRPGQYTRHAIHSRVDFTFNDKDLLINAQRDARENEPSVYKPDPDAWDTIEKQLQTLPALVTGRSRPELPPPLPSLLTDQTLATLKQYHQPDRQTAYQQSVAAYIQPLRKLLVIPDDQWQKELQKQTNLSLFTAQTIRIPSAGLLDIGSIYHPASDELRNKLLKSAAENFRDELQSPIADITLSLLQRKPTHVLDEDATTTAQNLAASRVPAERGQFNYKTNQIIKSAGKLDDRDWQLLKAEHKQFLQTLSPRARIQYTLGTVGVAALLSLLLCGYIARFQPRVIKNHARGLAIALLLLSMLLVAQLAALGSGPLYLFGLAPSILVAMILAVAYDRRFASGVAAVHALLVTVGLNQNVGFFLILLVGIFTCCFFMDEIRTRSKLIEIGGITALALMLATAAVSALSTEPVEPLRLIGNDTLYAGAAGLLTGFFVLGILPSIEKTFRITTSMTLLELADASQPLLRRLALECPEPTTTASRSPPSPKPPPKPSASIPSSAASAPTTTTSVKSTNPTTSAKTKATAETVT